MWRARPDSGAGALPLDGDWALTLSPAGAWASPDEADRGEWLRATVPGTAASALERLGLWDRRAPTRLHNQDVWFRTTVEGHGPATLVFEGLATIAEVWLDDRLIARSESMFAPLHVAVDLTGTHRLTLAFRSLSADLAARKGPRARWRTRMVDDARLRFVRTTILGHAPGWCPPIHAVGPWRPVLLQRYPSVTDVVLRSRLEDRDGVVQVSLALPDDTTDLAPSLVSGRYAAPLTRNETGRWHGTLRLPDVALWWPRSHGDQPLYDIRLNTARGEIPLGRAGFRDLVLDRGQDGSTFGLTVNGVRVFCRGACWTPDPVALGGRRQDYEPILRQLADANVNMVRVGGTMVYESDAFHALCDEFGILVWQDCMLANFDYPRDEAFTTAVLAEVTTLLRRTAMSPSLALLCGGSEILQQATMMGLTPDTAAHPLFDTHLPALVLAERPDLAYVPGSPSGGPLPFVADHGPTHYYGVGAYERPLEDARRANVRFASECLAFANVPEDATLHRQELDLRRNPDTWGVGVPRDNGASWTFEDTRHHYMGRLYGIDPLSLRDRDPQRYLDLSRAVTAEVSERTFDEWRRPGSATAGGLVWFARDLAPGSGWGIIDSDGRPKSNWYGLRRAFAPFRVSVTDEGVNGLVVHCVNDGACAVEGRLRIECLRAGAVRVAQGECDVSVPARGSLSLPAFKLFGSFFDAGCAYPFGEPPHDTVWASLLKDDDILAETHWLLDHARNLVHDDAPEVWIEQGPDGWKLGLQARRALQAVVIADESLRPDDNWFHLVPGRTKIVQLTQLGGVAPPRPRGAIRALNLASALPYG